MGQKAKQEPKFRFYVWSDPVYRGTRWATSIPHDKLQACPRMRIADRQVLELIRMWLQTPVVEAPEDKGGAPQVCRPKRGTPQGGVISPLLANLYLHGFDKVFHGLRGPRLFLGQAPYR